MSKQKDVKKDVLKEATLSPEELKQIKGKPNMKGKTQNTIE